MKTQLLAVSAAIHEFFIQHPCVLENQKKRVVLSSRYWARAKESINPKFLKDASTLIRRVIGYLAVEEVNILRNREQLTRSQSLYINTLQGFRNLARQLNNRIDTISVCNFIDQLTILEIEVRKAVATFDAEIISAQRLSISQSTSRRNTVTLNFSANETVDTSFALTIYDPSAEPTLERKVSWKENIEERHDIPFRARSRCI